MGIRAEELNWLNTEIARVREGVNQLNEQQKNWGIAFVEQRQRNETLKEQLARTEKDLAAAKEEAAKQRAIQEETIREEEEKSAELERLRRESDSLSQQLVETERRIAPIIDEISALNSTIEQLNQDIATKQKVLDDSESLLNELEGFQARKTQAMVLKPGLLQKKRCAEELLNESGESGNSEKTKLLAKYSSLAEKLQAMEFVLQGE